MGISSIRILFPFENISFANTKAENQNINNSKMAKEKYAFLKEIQSFATCKNVHWLNFHLFLLMSIRLLFSLNCKHFFIR
jgi:hypothetical protein